MKNSYLLKTGWLINGSGGPVKKDMLLHIENGFIKSINKVNRFDLNNRNLLDFSDCSMIPCLVDCHVHLFMSGTNNQKIRKNQINADFNDIKNIILKHINQALSCGVTGLRDGGDSQAHALRYKTECFDYNKFPIDLRITGKAWRNHGRYGKLIGRTPGENETLANAIENDHTQIDHVKIVNSGLNSLIQFGKETLPQFNLQEMKNAVKAANHLGRKVMVHANGRLPVNIAIESGCQSIEHGFFMGKENLQKMSDKNIMWVPTAFTMKAYSQYLNNRSIEAEIAEKNLEHQLKQIFQAREIGVPIALGTDAGSLGVHHGSSVFEELKLFMEAGFSIQEAVKCASLNGARLLGIDNKTGVLEKGSKACFIIIKGNPLNLFNNINPIKAVFINGLEFQHCQKNF